MSAACWQGDPRPREGQALRWVRPRDAARAADAAGRPAADPVPRGPALAARTPALADDRRHGAALLRAHPLRLPRRRRPRAGPAATRGLTAFVFWLALPALLVAKVGAAPLRDLLDPRPLAVFYGASFLLYGTTFALGRLAWRDPSGTAALRALGTVWGNYGYLGLPLLIAALGPAAALPTVAVIAGDILGPPC